MLSFTSLVLRLVFFGNLRIVLSPRIREIGRSDAYNALKRGCVFGTPPVPPRLAPNVSVAGLNCGLLVASAQALRPFFFKLKSNILWLTPPK
jgi:hypothetical protein